MDIGKHIQAIVDRLGTEAERIPLRRAVRSCLTDFDALRSRGLTWGQIAARLTQAGARDKAGRAIAAHNLRTEYARLAAEQDGDEVGGRVARHHPSGKKHEFSHKPIIKSTGSTVPTPSPAPRSDRLAEILKTRPRLLDLDD
ncbi:hypothetical protein HU675_0007840 [Bradyrhizobium septentrionale]|uniref:hypothetical protein n=1 Tax=Bradyrhizobium septentrionale TaxID=1404411 RepID=UPI0015970FE9|nr:hypothetical protein [Bradyrhizobium septentrionale]UGY26665.1 hypothetical protein HU675_0007840 [Bradyrhizobium septentrionale]